MIEEIIGYATKARKNGIVALEQDAEAVADKFLRKALNLAVDGTDLQVLRKMMELEISLEEHHGEAEAKVFEAAGRVFADHRHHRRGAGPDSGDEASGGHQGGRPRDRGGVCGDRLWRGGRQPVFSARREQDQGAGAEAALQMKELMLEGVIGIVEGLNPKLIRSKLSAYIHEPARRQESQRPSKRRRGDASAPEGAAAES